MKKNGFTLIEILVTIGLLSAIALVLFYGFNKIDRNNDIKECERIVSTFETAAEVYVEIGNSINTSVTLKVLREAGLIEPDLINPVTNLKFNYYTTVSSSYIYNNGVNVCEWFKI